MTTMTTMTVKQLRAACKRAGLPAYQRAGVRLKKADLIEQLAGRAGDVYRVEPLAARRPPAGRIPRRRRSDNDRLLAELATLPDDPAVALAVYRVLANEPDQVPPKPDAILRRREALAWGRLAQQADRAGAVARRDRYRAFRLRALGVVTA